MSPSIDFLTGTYANTTTHSSPEMQSNNQLDHILELYADAKKSDENKNKIIDELLIRYDYHQQQYLKDQQIITYAQSLKNENDALRDQIRRMQFANSSEHYVLVLFDGNCMIFNDHFLQNGNSGGLHAADVLIQNARNHTTLVQPMIGRDLKIMTLAYANARGLNDVLCNNAVVNRPALIDEFFQAFTSNPSFDFIDAGTSKAMARTKIAEALQHHIYDNRCLQIYLGCSSDESYASILQPYIQDPHTNTRLTLIEGSPFSRSLSILPFRHVTFGTLFRFGKLDLSAPDGIPAAFPTPIGTRIHQAAIPTPPSAVPTPPVRSTANTPSVMGPSMSPSAIPTPDHRLSVATSISSEVQNATENVAPKTWAKMAKEGAKVAEAEAVKAASIAAQKQKETKTPQPAKKSTSDEARDLLAQGIIPRNIKGQRIDPLERSHDHEHVQRVRRVKWCIMHFLSAKGCPFNGAACLHQHAPTPTTDDLTWLKLVARMQSCNYGTKCADLHCPYGHRCTAMVKDHSVGKPGKNCILGGECKFDASFHNVEMTIVKTTKV